MWISVLLFLYVEHLQSPFSGKAVQDMQHICRKQLKALLVPPRGCNDPYVLKFKGSDRKSNILMAHFSVWWCIRAIIIILRVAVLQGYGLLEKMFTFPEQNICYDWNG